MAFNYETMTDAQKAKFNTALGENAAFKEVMRALSAHTTPVASPETSEPGMWEQIEAVDTKYNTSRHPEERRRAAGRGGGGGGRKIDQPDDIRNARRAAMGLDPLSPVYTSGTARQDIVGILNDYGITSAADLKQVVRGSHNDLYPDLGVGNAIYNDKSTGFEPHGGSARDVNISNAENTAIGEYGLVEQGKDASFLSNPFFEIVAAVAAPFTYGLSTVALKAAQAADGVTLDSGDYGQAALAVASPYISKGIGQVPGLGNAYTASNLGGSFVQGTTNSVINQAVIDGKIDLEDALKSGAFQAAGDTALDLFGDAKQTNDGNLIEGIDTVNGAPITPDQIADLTNTSDLYGLLGEEGLLSKVGINTGYLKTDYLGAGLDLIGQGGRPALQNFDSAKERYDASLERIQGQGLSVEETGQAIEAAQDQFYQDTARYDERFFDLTSERGDSPLAGIHEKNPYASSGSSFPFISGGGEGTVPSSSISTKTPIYTDDTNITPITDKAFSDYMSRNPTADIGDDYLPEIESTDTPAQEELVSEEELLGTTDPVGDYDQAEDPLAAQEDIEEAVNDLPGLSIDDLPAFKDIPTTEVSEDELPSSEESSPPTGGGSNTPGKLPSVRKRGAPNDEEDAFRLASILKIEGLPQNIAVAAMTRLRALLSKRETSRVEGDATHVLDPETGRYIQRYSGDTREEMQASMDPDPVQQALDEVLAG